LNEPLRFTSVPNALAQAVICLLYIGYNWRARRSQSLPNALALIGLVANAGGAAASAATIMRPDHPVVWLGGTLYLLNAIWLLWLGRQWLTVVRTAGA
jgi:hypothetical protein